VVLFSEISLLTAILDKWKGKSSSVSVKTALDAVFVLGGGHVDEVEKGGPQKG
jgi:nitrogenase subunit NifH